MTAPNQWLRWRRARDCTTGRRRAAREGRPSSPPAALALREGSFCLRPGVDGGIAMAASGGKGEGSPRRRPAPERGGWTGACERGGAGRRPQGSPGASRVRAGGEAGNLAEGERRAAGTRGLAAGKSGVGKGGRWRRPQSAAGDADPALNCSLCLRPARNLGAGGSAAACLGKKWPSPGALFSLTVTPT